MKCTFFKTTTLAVLLTASNSFAAVTSCDYLDQKMTLKLAADQNCSDTGLAFSTNPFGGKSKKGCINDITPAQMKRIENDLNSNVNNTSYYDVCLHLDKGSRQIILTNVIHQLDEAGNTEGLVAIKK